MDRLLDYRIRRFWPLALIQMPSSGCSDARGEPYSVFFNTALEPERELSLGHALQRAGYRTGHVGKWRDAASREDVAALPTLDPDDDPRDPGVAALLC